MYLGSLSLLFITSSKLIFRNSYQRTKVRETLLLIFGNLSIIMACNCIQSDSELLGSEINWAELPIDLLDLILSKLVLIPDYIRFGVVCKEWHSVAINQKLKRIQLSHQQPPMLLIPDGGSTEHRNLCSVFEDNKVYHYQLPIPFSKRCCGSSYGWWAFAEEDLSITLINPFSRRTMHLPRIMEFPHTDSYDDEGRPLRPKPVCLIHKVILSCDPCLYPDNYVVAAIHGLKPVVGFITSGDQSWSYPYRRFSPVNDIRFYRGRIYAVNSDDQLVVVDYSPSCNRRDIVNDIGIEDEDWNEDKKTYSDGTYRGAAPMAYLITRVSEDFFEYSMVSYLVESLEGDLLLVRRIHFWDEDDYNYQVTANFKVYKLTTKHSRDKEESKWVEIQSLTDSALFLGDNHSICISATGFPNCRPNTIYFTDDNVERDIDETYEAIDMGVFHLENGQIEKHYDLPQPLRCMPPAVWICPRLQ